MACVKMVGVPVPTSTNFDAWELFEVSKSCVRVAGMSGVVIGFDWPSVRTMAEALGIEWSETLLERMLYAENLLVAHLSKERK